MGERGSGGPLLVLPAAGNTSGSELTQIVHGAAVPGPPPPPPPPASAPRNFPGPPPRAPAGRARPRPTPPRRSRTALPPVGGTGNRQTGSGPRDGGARLPVPRPRSRAPVKLRRSVLGKGPGSVPAAKPALPRGAVLRPHARPRLPVPGQERNPKPCPLHSRGTAHPGGCDAVVPGSAGVLLPARSPAPCGCAPPKSLRTERRF